MLSKPTVKLKMRVKHRSIVSKQRWNAGTQTVNSDFKVKTQTHAATQTYEFEYLFKETVIQPFTEEYFVNNEDRVRFYTGLPGFGVLNTTFRFVSPFVSRKSKTLTLFQEFVMVLIKDLMFHYKTWPFGLESPFQLFQEHLPHG